LTTASRLSAFWIGPNWAAATMTTRMDSFLSIFMATLQEIRRKIERSCELAVQSPNRKCSRMGLVTKEIARRKHRIGQAGGESVSQSLLKDQALLTFLGQNPPFELLSKTGVSPPIFSWNPS
jgi:hypothetical protein